MTALDDTRTSCVQALNRLNIATTVRTLLRLVFAVDAVTILFCALVAWQLRALANGWGMAPIASDHLALQSIPFLMVGWLIVLTVRGGYSVRNFGSGSEEFRIVGQSSFISAGIVGLTSYLLNLPLSRGFVVIAFLLGSPLLLIERYLVRQSVHTMRHKGRLLHRVIAVGGPSGVSEVVDALQRTRNAGYQVVGACVPDTIAVEPPRFPVPIVGRVQNIRRVCSAMGADTVLVAGGGYASAQELRRIAWNLEDSSIDLIVVPSLTDVAGPRIHMRPVAGLPLLHVEQPQAGKAGGLSKRCFDIVISAICLLALSPILIAVAVMVKLHDGDPVLFRQSRVGRHGEPFQIMKFRSMAVDAESQLADLLDLNESDGVLFKMKNDPRVTPVGRFMRRYSLDELPQLVNVLQGSMSLVGPRPPLASEVDKYAVDVHRRLLVRPGLTGLWQVSGRSSLSWDEAVRLDLFYVDNWSMTSDLVIMAKTVRAVLGHTGAY